MPTLLDIYSPPKPKTAPTGIPGLDDEEPVGDSPLLADMQAKRQALAIQRQQAQQSAAQAQQSAAQERRQQADYDREQTDRRNQQPIPAGLAPSGASVGPDGKVTRQYAAPTPVTTGIISEKDVADAGIDPNSIPRNQWPAAIAKAKSGREGKMTEMQSNALQYSARMAYNRDILDKLEGKGFDPASVGTGVQHFTPNIMRSPEVQTYRAARDNWVSAVLRKESGAAISKSEYENAYRQYFPQMGDAPEIIKQKRDLRKIAEDNMKLVAGGRAAEAETGIPGTGTPPAQPNAAPAPAATPQQPTQEPILTDKSQFDALPSGSFYIRGGKRYQKP